MRKVTCQQILALGQVLTKTSSHCNPTSRPAESKPCNFAKICSKDEQVPTTTPTTTTSSVTTPDLPKNQWTHQNFVQQSQKKKVTLKVGGKARGKATVFKGRPSQDPLPCQTLRQVRSHLVNSASRKRVRRCRCSAHCAALIKFSRGPQILAFSLETLTEFSLSVIDARGD